MKKKVKVNFGSFKNAKIGTKLSIAIGVLTTVCLIVLNLSAISISGNALDQTTDDQIVQVCQTNVEKVNTVMQVCNTISDSIKDSLELMYDKNYDKSKSYKSQVNGKMLSKSQYDAENAMLSNIWAAVSKNDNILGAGVLFEPNAFSSSIKDYSIYGYKTDLETRTTDTITYESNSIEDFYSVPKNEGAICFSEPYEDGVTKDMVMSVGYPITGNGEFKGIVLLDVKSNVFNVLAAKNEQFPSLHINIMNGNGMILYDSIQSEIVGGNISDVLSEKEVTEFNSKSEKKEAFEMTTYPEKNKTFCYFTPVQIGNSTWWIQTALLSSEFNATNNKLKLILNFIAILAVIIAVICTYTILKRLLKPIVIMEKAAVEMSKGSLNVEIDYESKDELGRLADSMRTMMVSINTIISDMVFGLEELANGNFNIEVKNKDCYIGDYLPLKNSVEVIITKLNQTLGDIKVASDQVNSGADQVSSAAQALSQGATEQASAVEELSATMTEMSGKIQHNADKSDEARLLSQAAGQEVKVSNQKMEDMSSAMADITDKSNEIGKIIKTIDDIAFQTNILALNAAVEAARAGAAGKGFAVVADEVRNLASKSAEAAKNTTVLIESAVEAIANGDRLTNETAESLMAVSENTEKIAKLIDEISIASSEQSVGVSQINTGLEQISSVVQTNSATAEESAAASEELSGQANTMNILISEFQLHD